MWKALGVVSVLMVLGFGACGFWAYNTFMPLWNTTQTAMRSLEKLPGVGVPSINMTNTNGQLKITVDLPASFNLANANQAIKTAQQAAQAIQGALGQVAKGSLTVRLNSQGNPNDSRSFTFDLSKAIPLLLDPSKI